MKNGHSSLREFGRCRLDVEKKVLWSNGETVQLPLKAVELLCVLVDTPGAVVTKEEIWRAVWNDSFVEETNLTHNIYVLRKTLKDLGEDQLI
jgi:DNA-binding winged helix-turn-helix (wHTH) protein